MMRSPVTATGAFQKLRSMISGPVRALGWPALCGVGLMLAGALLLVVSRQLRLQDNKLQLQLQQAQASNPKPALSPTRGIPVIFPSSADYTADLAQIFDIAKSQGIVLVSGDYRDADPTALGLDTRLVDLRINENYGKLKEFLASVLNAMPHAAVQELRIERKDGTAAKHQVFLKLALVYAPRPGSTQGLQSPSQKAAGVMADPGSARGLP